MGRLFGDDFGSLLDRITEAPFVGPPRGTEVRSTFGSSTSLSSTKQRPPATLVSRKQLTPNLAGIQIRQCDK